MEEKKEEAKQPAEEKKRDEKTPPAPAPTPTPEIVLKVYMHCEGCARKVRRSLKGFQGVEDVMTDWKTQKVVVRGEKADPVKVLERVQKKSHRKVELISPIPKPPSTAEDEKKPQEKEKEKMTLPEEKKKEEEVEPKTIITVVLKVHMHCEACAQEIQRRILRMKGVESARSDLKNSQVSVKGAFEPAKLVEFVYKRTGKKAIKHGVVEQDDLLRYDLVQSYAAYGGPARAAVAVGRGNGGAASRWSGLLYEASVDVVISFLLLVAWLVLPHFNGAAFLYDKFVREHIKRYVTGTEHRQHHSPNHKEDKSPTRTSKGKKKFVDFLTPKKGDHEVY
ncbi:heavy metal-associated isoprenylated plant protein 3-like [Senna tora]|uniref:Heavy metal-associated isoprenylated plant protein 3-like n=1 Tax=Senna tora TaxID=362788 RepID=A0A834X6F5_9FABA|nr:heavy metal-associated isoprenylated plant protein 3-like [Senna tora]